MRYFLILAALSAVLSACAAPRAPVPQEPPADCARSLADGEEDGGLGGTGNAPEPCEEQKIVE
jgi:hypothetical protein